MFNAASNRLFVSLHFVWQIGDTADCTRFASVSDERIEHLLDRRLSQNTKRVIDNSVTVFSTYLHARDTSLGFLYQLPQTEVNKHLLHFYTEVRKKDGSLYTRNGLASLRYGLQKHFSKTCGYDIINDFAFRSSSEVFSAILIEMKKQGKGFVQHKQQISSDDFSKLYTSSVLSTADPVGLQNKVFVDLLVHLCNHRRENLRDMKKTDFQILVNPAGNRYVTLNSRFAKLGKNLRGESGENAGDVPAVQQRRMNQLPGSPRCPVMSFEKYISKLSGDLDDFWQKPVTRIVTEEDVCWYDSVPVGKNMLASKMKTLSIDASLSAMYTNHSLQATCITAVESVSCRKPANSLVQYSVGVPDSNKQRRSDIFVIAEWQPARI